MPSLCCNNQVRDSSFINTNHGRSCSKAQASLTKILHLISTIPPPPPENRPNPCNNKGFDIDINLRLGSFLDDETQEKSESSAENSFVGKNPDGDDEEIQEKNATETDVSSDVTEMQKSGEGKTAATRFNDSLDLLIEAAEMISGKGKEIEDDVSPVVRSKRGRCQVLPQRFRDSVLEPWKKKRARRSAAMVSDKKRK